MQEATDQSLPGRHGAGSSPSLCVLGFLSHLRVHRTGPASHVSSRSWHTPGLCESFKNVVLLGQNSDKKIHLQGRHLKSGPSGWTKYRRWPFLWAEVALRAYQVHWGRKLKAQSHATARAGTSASWASCTAQRPWRQSIPHVLLLCLKQSTLLGSVAP